MAQEKIEKLEGHDLILFYDILVYYETKICKECATGLSQYDGKDKRHAFFSAIGFSVAGVLGTKKLKKRVSEENVMAKIEELSENSENKIFIANGENLIKGCIKHIRNAFAHVHVQNVGGEYRMYDINKKKKRTVTMYGRIDKECAEKLKAAMYADFNIDIAEKIKNVKRMGQQKKQR